MYNIPFTLYRVLIFGQHEVVLAHSDDENNGSDTFKAVNPFLAFGPLAADVEHSDEQKRHAIDSDCTSSAMLMYFSQRRRK